MKIFNAEENDSLVPFLVVFIFILQSHACVETVSVEETSMWISFEFLNVYIVKFMCKPLKQGSYYF